MLLHKNIAHFCNKKRYFKNYYTLITLLGRPIYEQNRINKETKHQMLFGCKGIKN